MMNTNPNSNTVLSTLLQQEIEQAGGSISFARFMEQTLYHPQFGYYNQANFAIGKKGDFTTAPEISPVFAYCLAKQCADVLIAIADGAILELGAGTGRMACDLIHALKKLSALPTTFYILEINLELQKKQRELLSVECPFFIEHIIWLEKVPENFNGIIIANEVLDAIPIHCFKIMKQTLYERRVCFEKNNFTWCLQSNIHLTQLYQNNQILKNLPNNYTSEINLNIPNFIKKLANCLQTGVILFFDYGYGEREYYDHRRTTGTLTCFYQHQQNQEPFARIGLQDITAHVNFTQVIQHAVANQLNFLGFTTQQQFLLACGLLESMQDLELNSNEVDKFTLHQAIKQLVWPTEMGERVKVMAVGKGKLPPLRGFIMGDRSREL